jgi:hypothetical protein
MGKPVLVASLAVHPETGGIGYSVDWLTDLAASERGLKQFMFVF